MSAPLNVWYSLTLLSRRPWLGRLHNILRPLVPRHGSLFFLRLELIPEAGNSFRIVKQWVLDVLHSLDPSRPDSQHEFLNSLFNAITIGQLLDEPLINHVLGRVHCIRNCYHPALRIRRVDGGDANALLALIDVFVSREQSDLVRGTLFLK